MEKLHLKFLKWTLRVHKKCSNLACYGDSGRYPLAVKLSKQFVSYYNRLDSLNAADDPSLVRHAFVEQGLRKLSWYQSTKTLLKLAGHDSEHLANPLAVRSELQGYFNRNWDRARGKSKKLTYYNQVKKCPSIGLEPFLSLSDIKERQCLMRLRSSSHRLNCKTARYITEKDLNKHQWTHLWTKRCQFCTTEETLEHLPIYHLVISLRRTNIMS